MNLLADAFGDDEHTGAVDAYTRVMKCRKWVVLSATAFWVAHQPQFVPVKFGLGVANMSIGREVWETATAAGLLYIVLQYALLLAQLGTRYDVLLEQRLGFRALARLRDLKLELSMVNREIHDIKSGIKTGGLMPEDTLMQLEERRQNLTERMNSMRDKLDEPSGKELYSQAYVFAEKCIDMARVAVPVVVVTLAVLNAPSLA